MTRTEKRRLAAGVLIGAGAGLTVSLFSQLAPRFELSPEVVFPGAPQGLDQWTYFSMCRALWRSPNGLTYVYPYCLFWPAPAVLFQFPLLVLAWLGRLIGLPAAFEAARVAGAAAAGGALAMLGGHLIREASWRRWFWVAAVAGGGWFTWGAVVIALQVAGLPGLTEVWAYLPKAEGALYWWAPFLAQNLRYPLECIYHALVLGALACLASRRYRTALALYLITWLSNPFPAVALGAAALPWWLWTALKRRGAEPRRAAAHLAGWVAVTLIGAGYYGPFLGQWPALKNLSEQYHVGLVEPLEPWRLLLLGGPWLLGLIWSMVAPAGRRHVWGRPAWRLFGLLSLSQLALMQQGWLIGDRALQPFHFNRGYLHLGLVVVAWRVALVLSRWRRTRAGRGEPALSAGPAGRRTGPPRWMIVAVVLTLGDQAFFILQNHLEGQAVGFVQRSYADLVTRLEPEPPGALVLVEREAAMPSYVTAFSDHVAYSAPETMVVPFPEERQHRLDEALAGRNGGVAALGVDFAIIAAQGRYAPPLRTQGWRELAREGDLLLLAPPLQDAGNPGAAPNPS